MHEECAKEALVNLDKRFGSYQFFKLVNGALLSSLDSHGDITKQNVGSASKRVSKQVWHHFKTIMYESCKNGDKNAA